MASGPEDVAEAPRACSSCRGQDLTRVPMVLADSTPVVFVSCQRCESREWLAQDDDGRWSSLPIESVLARSAKQKRS